MSRSVYMQVRAVDLRVGDAVWCADLNCDVYVRGVTTHPEWDFPQVRVQCTDERGCAMLEVGFSIADLASLRVEQGP